MASDDFAILTGISWYPAAGYTELEGPQNDVTLVKQWLRDPLRGNVPEDRIKTILTPAPKPYLPNPRKATPVLDDFNLIFGEMLEERLALRAERVTSGRLYLYFSGHGFASRDQYDQAEAALYCANATRSIYDHIFGTGYARAARSRALFKEIVLIMDCCRDADTARTPRAPSLTDSPSDAMAAQCRLMEIYAVPKGGQAPERLIPERGAVHGLLTHALFKLLEELDPSSADGVSSTVLRNNLLASWKTIAGDTLRPEVHLPGNGDISFQTVKRGCEVSFSIPASVPPTCVLTIVEGRFLPVASFDLEQRTLVGEPGEPLIAHEFRETTLTLRLAPGVYLYTLTGPIESRQRELIANGSAVQVHL